MSNKELSQEQKAVRLQRAAQESEQKVDFEEWYALRKGAIPGQHRKEILKADFKGRGLSLNETVKAFDEALNKYGVKLA